MDRLKGFVASAAKWSLAALPLIWPLPILLALTLTSDLYREPVLAICGLFCAAAGIFWLVRIINRGHAKTPPDRP